MPPYSNSACIGLLYLSVNKQLWLTHTERDRYRVPEGAMDPEDSVPTETEKSVPLTAIATFSGLSKDGYIFHHYSAHSILSQTWVLFTCTDIQTVTEIRTVNVLTLCQWCLPRTELVKCEHPHLLPCNPNNYFGLNSGDRLNIGILTQVKRCYIHHNWSQRWSHVFITCVCLNKFIFYTKNMNNLLF